MEGRWPRRKKKEIYIDWVAWVGDRKNAKSPLGSLLLFNNEVGYRFKKSHKFSVK